MERSQKDYYFMLMAAILDFGRHFGKKEILQKYCHNSSIILTNFELSNIKTKKVITPSTHLTIKHEFAKQLPNCELVKLLNKNGSFRIP